jgi:hypothetical protein
VRGTRSPTICQNRARGACVVRCDDRLHGPRTRGPILEHSAGREYGPSQDDWIYLGERDDPQPRLVFQPVSEPAAGKVRIHLDVTVDDIENAKVEVIKLGGTATGERHDYDEGVVVVMADPEGHEFCLVQYNE